MTQLKKTVLFIAFFAGTIIGLTACNSDEKSTDTKEVAEESNEVKFDNTNTEKDARFLVNAAEINLEEIKLGQLAQQKGTMTDVKEFGKMMEQAHTKAMAETDTLAKKMLITIPASPTENALDAYKKLNNKSGTDFDKAYCKMMVNGHKDAISLFEKASTDLNNAGIKQWAADMLPGLRTHLDNAIECQKKCEAMK
jgi:putative membrane protein